MEIPEMQEKAPYDGSCALITFGPIITPEFDMRYPITLEDLTVKPHLHIYKITKEEPADGTAGASYGNCLDGDVFQQLEVADRFLQRFSGRVFSIHTTSVLQRLLHLYQLRNQKILRGFSGVMLGDLVKEFHGGAVLTFAERVSFKGKQVAAWLGFPDGEVDIEAMVRLARRVSNE